jgi:GNAT superfamily N-acetyltransferase
VTPAFEFGPVTEADFDELVALRIAVMRASLERLGRFDPQRAVQRFRSTFRPADTRRILVGGEAAGCVGYWPEADGDGEAMRVEHFYLAERFQRLGLGSAVLRRLFDEAPPQATRFRVGALRDSDANRFYLRQGFMKVSEDDWDIAYERPRLPAPVPMLTGGCLCGAVRYAARPTHHDGYYCHCRMCQLAFGNTRAAFINLRKDEVRWTAGTPRFYASSKFARRGFCADCGTPLSFEYLGSERMDLSVGSLDDPAAITPTTHFAVESRIANWHGDDGLRGQRLDEHAALTERWKSAYGDGVEPGVAAARGTAAGQR